MSLKHTLLLGTLLVLLGTGCAAPEMEESTGPLTASLRKVDEIIIQETDSLFIGDFWNLFVAEDPLRLYVADRMLHRIAVVDQDGRILRMIGSFGQGPGELNRPQKALVVDDRLIVEASRRFTVFDTTGRYLANLQLPPGFSQGDQWSLTHYDGHYYVAAIDVNLRSSGLRASPEDKVVARLDTAFHLVKHFGSFPAFYQEDEYLWRFCTLDVSPEGLLAVGYYLLPEVYVYDLRQPDIPLVKVIELDHPAFMPVKNKIPINLSISESKKVAQGLSFIWHTYFVNDSTVVQTFHNRTAQFYESLSDKEMSFYAMIGTMSGASKGRVSLPGPIVGRDSKGRLYMRMIKDSDGQDLQIYKIGIYEVVWSAES